MDLQTTGKLLLGMALGLAVLGAVLWLGGRLGLGVLPGDINLQGRGWSCAFPIASSIVISIILTLLVNLLIRWFGR
jgi:hypothetical protein